MIQKPKVIYKKELPPVGLKHKFGTYVQDEDEKLNTLQIIQYGILRKDMLAKYHRKYDIMLLNFKAFFAAALICSLLLYVCVHSDIMSEKVSNISSGYDPSDTYFNRGLDYLILCWNDIYYNISNYFKN